MFAIKLAVRVHHLRFNPQAKIHSQRMHFVDEWLESIGEFFRIHKPVSETGAVAISFSEPSIIDNKALHSDACGLFRERLLPRFIHMELRRLPGVVQNGPEVWVRRVWQNRCDLKTM